MKEESTVVWSRAAFIRTYVIGVDDVVQQRASVSMETSSSDCPGDQTWMCWFGSVRLHRFFIFLLLPLLQMFHLICCQTETERGRCVFITTKLLYFCCYWWSACEESFCPVELFISLCNAVLINDLIFVKMVKSRNNKEDGFLNANIQTVIHDRRRCPPSLWTWWTFLKRASFSLF